MLLLRFLSDRCASAAPLLALAALPIMGALGTAIDYSRANSARSAMQASVDATALAMARDSAVEPQSYFNGNFTRSEVQLGQVTATSGSSGGQSTVTVSATGSVKTVILGVMGFSKIDIKASSTAAAMFDGYGCVLSLNKSVSGAFTGQGSTSVALKGCSLYDNSNSSTALTVGGSAKVSALSVGVVGGVSPGSEGLTADFGIRTGIRPVVDPYKDVQMPNVGACTQNNYKANNSVTIDPGVYCGGIDIHAGATVTLNPGIYFIDGGELLVNGKAGLVGTGVTLIFTSKNSKSWGLATINGNAMVDLRPPGYGATAGIVMFGDRGIPAGTTFKLNGGADQNFAGAIYLPTSTINFSGGNATSMSCTQIIGDVVNFTGNSSLAINCSSYQTKPFGMWTIRLAS